MGSRPLNQIAKVILSNLQKATIAKALNGTL